MQLEIFFELMLTYPIFSSYKMRIDTRGRMVYDLWSYDHNFHEFLKKGKTMKKLSDLLSSNLKLVLLYNHKRLSFTPQHMIAEIINIMVMHTKSQNCSVISLRI